MDVGDQRDGHIAGHARAAAQADRLRRRADCHHHLDRGDGGYDGGAGYTAAKHAQGALHRTLRGELLGKPVRLTEIAPGAVETEFSLVRFDGDRQRADAVYTGITPLVAADIAEVIGFVASRPAHVNLDQIIIRPRDQASASRFNRRG